MKADRILLTVALSCLVLYGCSGNSGTADAENDPEHDEIVKRDLFAIISLQGADCGAVVEYELKANLDYVAVCENGDRYRVHVDKEGVVNVNEH